MRPQLPDGYTAKFFYTRPVDACGRPLAKSGITLAEIFGSDGILVASAEAWCNPRDGFNRRIGRDIALGRALKKLAAKTGSQS